MWWRPRRFVPRFRSGVVSDRKNRPRGLRKGGNGDPRGFRDASGVSRVAQSGQLRARPRARPGSGFPASAPSSLREVSERLTYPRVAADNQEQHGKGTSGHGLKRPELQIAQSLLGGDAACGSRIQPGSVPRTSSGQIRRGLLWLYSNAHRERHLWR